MTIKRLFAKVGNGSESGDIQSDRGCHVSGTSVGKSRLFWLEIPKNRDSNYRRLGLFKEWAICGINGDFEVLNTEAASFPRFRWVNILTEQYVWWVF